MINFDQDPKKTYKILKSKIPDIKIKNKNFMNKLHNLNISEDFWWAVSGQYAILSEYLNMLSFKDPRFLNDLTKSIFTGDKDNKVSSIRRNLQTAYVRRLIDILAQDYYDELATAAAYNSLREIQKIVRRSSSDVSTKSHRKLVSWIIESGLDRAN